MEKYFKPVSDLRRAAYNAADNANFVENMEQRLAEKRAREEEKQALRESNRKIMRIQAQERRSQAGDVDVRTDYEVIQDDLENIFAEDTADGSVVVAKKPLKTWNKRPENWRFIAEESMKFGTAATIKDFKEEFAGLSATAANQRLIAWRKEIKNGVVTDYSVRAPVYGTAIDK